MDVAPPEGRRQSLLATVLPESLPLPPSFLSTSPIAREILRKDIEECSSDDGDGDEDGAEPRTQAPADDSESETVLAAAPEGVKLAFHPNGVAYGCGFSTVALPGLDRPVPNPREIEESLQEEVSLLRDNDLLPPKHHRPRNDSIVDSLYRHVFNTAQDGDNATTPSEERPGETSPLLGGGAVTPPAREVHELWEEAVAAHKVRTTWQREAKTLVRYAAPLIATFLLHYSVTIGSVLTVGRLGMLELAAVNCKSSPSLSYSTLSLVCFWSFSCFYVLMARGD